MIVRLCGPDEQLTGPHVAPEPQFARRHGDIYSNFPNS